MSEKLPIITENLALELAVESGLCSGTDEEVFRRFWDAVIYETAHEATKRANRAKENSLRYRLRRWLFMQLKPQTLYVYLSDDIKYAKETSLFDAQLNKGWGSVRVCWAGPVKLQCHLCDSCTKQQSPDSGQSCET